MKRRTLVNSSLGPDSSTMTLNNPLDNGKTHAGSFELLCRVEPLEHTEQLFAILHVEPRAVVFDEIGVLLHFVSRAADLDGSGVRRPGELDRIGQQVHQHLPYHGSVAASRGEVSETTFDVAFGGPELEFVEDRLGQLVHVDRRRRRRRGGR